MKLIKKYEIRWDIVRHTALHNPLWLLGWPLQSFYSKWGVSKNTPLFTKRSYETRPNIVVRLPWSFYDKRLKASLTIIWMGWFFFWRNDY